MPIYRNISSLRKELNGKVVESGKEISSLTYYDENSIGLLKIKDHPMFNPVLLSQVITSNSEILIPKVDNLNIPVFKYAIHFYVEKGEVSVQFNSIENKPVLNLYTGCRWNIRIFERTIDKLILNSTKEFILHIIVEKV